MPRWKSHGYVIVEFVGDHPPRHVHVYRDRELVAKFNLDNGRFMLVDERHRGRVLAALRAVGFAK
jgi:hypothetical protein